MKNKAKRNQQEMKGFKKSSKKVSKKIQKEKEKKTERLLLKKQKKVVHSPRTHLILRSLLVVVLVLNDVSDRDHPALRLVKPLDQHVVHASNRVNFHQVHTWVLVAKGGGGRIVFFLMKKTKKGKKTERHQIFSKKWNTSTNVEFGVTVSKVWGGGKRWKGAATGGRFFFFGCCFLYVLNTHTLSRVDLNRVPMTSWKRQTGKQPNDLVELWTKSVRYGTVVGTLNGCLNK